MPKPSRSPRGEIERAFHVSFKFPEQAAQLLDAYEAQVRDAAIAEAAARIKALHHPYRSVYDEGDNRSCAHCNQLTGYAVPYPCDTVKALDSAGSDRSDSTPEGTA